MIDPFELRNELERLTHARESEPIANCIYDSEKLVQLVPHNPDVQFEHAATLEQANDFLNALKHIENALALNPRNSSYLIKSSAIYTQLGNTDRAIARAKDALDVGDNQRFAFQALTNAFEAAGSHEQTQAAAEEWKKDGSAPVGYLAMLETRSFNSQKKYSQAIDSARRGLSEMEPVSKDTNNIARTYFQLAKSYDRLGEFDNAWEAVQKAHAVGNTEKYPIQGHIKTYEDVQNFMSSEILDILPRADIDTQESIFVVGSPRSGTSLLEQIMSMHPEIKNGGEMSSGSLIQSQLPFATDSLLSWPQNCLDLDIETVNSFAEAYKASEESARNGARYVSNKALNLDYLIGLLSVIVPNSKAIMLHRHPLDTCISCHMTDLLLAGHLYTSTFKDLAEVWISREKARQFWSTNLSIPVMQLSYDQLVANQEAESKRLIGFLDLPWEEKCLSFHTSKNRARTISHDQVNQKMYSSSSGRWKNYEKHIGPLIDALADYL